MEASESVSPTAGIDDLIDESLGVEPNTDSEPEVAAQDASGSSPVAPGDAQEPEPTQAVAQEGQTPQEAKIEPTPQSFRVGDRDYTISELQAALTSAQQLPHLQKKYVEALEQARQQPQQGQQDPNQPKPANLTPQAYMEQLRSKFDPVVKQYVENGLMESDFVTLFPGMAAQMAYYQTAFDSMSNVVRAVAGEMESRTRREQSTGLVNEVAQSINQLAQSGEPFAPLKEPQKVQEFFNFLWELNPQVGQLRNPEFLARQWVAFNKDQYLQALQSREQTTARNQAARLARADATGGTRAPGVNQEPPKSPLDEMWDDHVALNR